MKKIYSLIVLFILLINSSWAQTTLKVTIDHANSKTFTLINKKTSFETEFPNNGYEIVSLNGNVKDLDISEPTFLTISYQQKSPQKDIFYDLYVTPGDQLLIQADLNQPDYHIRVSGKGSKNNQPLLSFRKESFSLKSFYGDTLPAAALTAIKNKEIEIRKNFAGYVRKYKPTETFIRDWELNMQYFTADMYCEFATQNKFQVKDFDLKYQSSWRKVQDSLFLISHLNNNLAINTPHYISLLQSVILNETQFFLTIYIQDPLDRDKFFQEWYQSSADDGMEQVFINQGVNLLSEKIIQKYFTGRSAAYLYVVLLEDATRKATGDKNLPDIFNRFKQQFPSNEYIKWFQPSIDKIALNKQNKLSDKMFFFPENGSKLNTFEEVLSAAKGKTVLLDMWGTWCAPCRTAIEQNGPIIKAYFKDKGLDYLYIANRDLRNEEGWKKMIAYYNMEGAHILANEVLSKDILKKVQGIGYPTYILIRKDGSYEQLKAAHPFDQKVLFKQLETALAM